MAPPLLPPPRGPLPIYRRGSLGAVQQVGGGRDRQGVAPQEQGSRRPQRPPPRGASAGKDCGGVPLGRGGVRRGAPPRERGASPLGGGGGVRRHAHRTQGRRHVQGGQRGGEEGEGGCDVLTISLSFSLSFSSAAAADANAHAHAVDAVDANSVDSVNCDCGSDRLLRKRNRCDHSSLPPPP